MNVELFEATLESDGHEVAVERDGVSGEARALAESFDVVLLDIHLPKRSGIDVCRSLRASGRSTLIIALSASVLPDEVQRTKSAGFDLFLAKPVAPSELRAAVRALSRAQGA